MTTDNWRRLQVAVLTITFLGLSTSSAAYDKPEAFSYSNERFGLRLFTRLGLSKPGSNVAVSPLLLQSALALLYSGVPTDSIVSQQLRVALDLQHLGTSEQILQYFEQVIPELKQSTATTCRFRLYSEFFTEERFTFNYRDAFVARAAPLSIGVNRLNFDSVENVAQTINYQFIKCSNFNVGELVNSSLLLTKTGSDTPFLHVSGLSLLAPWAQGFDPQKTQHINFFRDEQNHKLVEAMFLQHSIRYAELPSLDACLIELPYATANLSLLIIYPNQVNGLSQLEYQLQNYDLKQLRQQLSERELSLTLPKFNLVAHTELRSILQQLGLGKLFTSEAQLHNVFSSFLASSAPHLTAVPHAAILEVQEAGGNVDRTFVAAFTDIFRSTLSVVINHPFAFVLGNGETLILAGHVVDI